MTNINNIDEWLHSLGLDQYASTFRENDIDTELVRELNADDLTDLGVKSVGHRKQLMKAIAALDSDQTEIRQSKPVASATAVARSDAQYMTTSQAERRQLTVMFCDLVGSTALSAKYDPEDLSEIVRTYQENCASIIGQYEGHIARYMGDGMLVYFGYPQAHEDDAERALRAGLEIIGRVAQLKPRKDLILQTRVGVATGLVVVGETIGDASSREQVVMGETPNLAARLQSFAEPDQLVISDRTRGLSGDLFEYVEPGKHKFKGFLQPLTVHQVVAERFTESRFAARSRQHLLPIVGREQEIDLLAERWRLAKAGEGQLVLLAGEAGIGKSRIAKAMIDAVAEDEHYRINYQCSPYHSDSALYPTIQQLTLGAGITSANDGETRLRKLDALLQQAGEMDADSVQYRRCRPTNCGRHCNDSLTRSWCTNEVWHQMQLTSSNMR